MSSLSTNPLARHFRQPILHITLPSNGRWYPEGTLEMPATGEVPIYAMTAKDELTMKTPDALMNGAATASIIQSCCPSIKDPWKMPVIDLDTLLLSIRIATYGKELEFTAVCPHCSSKVEQGLDISVMMDKINPGDWNQPISVNGLTIKMRPLSFKDYNSNNMTNFDEQRIIQVVQNDELSDAEKQKKFDEIFQKLIDTGINAVSKNVEYILNEEGERVSDQGFILEFLNNCDKSIWDAIRSYLDVIKENNRYNEVDLTCTNDECGKPFMSPFLFEQTNFFG
jgi:hypothetical protein